MDMLSINDALPLRRGSARLPGESGVWLVVGGELAVFTLVFGAFVHTWAGHRSAFGSAAETSMPIGAVNTVLLLTSSAAIATGVQWARDGRVREARRCVIASLVLGLGFVALKSVEYGIELREGWTSATNPFWMYYYAITGLHLAHVLVGLAALRFAARTLAGPTAFSSRSVQHLESCATYWHLVDVLWIVIFPLVYLAAR